MRQQHMNGLLALALAGLALSTTVQAAGNRYTVEGVGRSSKLSTGYKNGQAYNLLGTVQFGNGDVLQTELLQESKFGSRGGLIGASYNFNFAQVWSLTPTLVLGHGNRNWSRARLDIEAARKWGPNGLLITRLASYGATYDRSGKFTDGGIRLGATVYLPARLVLDAGITRNNSMPGNMRSNMPFLALTEGAEGSHYITLRLSKGDEAYRSINGDLEVPVVLNSSTLSLSGRQWLGEGWGLSGSVERYVNQSYRRTTLGVGVFAQF